METPGDASELVKFPDKIPGEATPPAEDACGKGVGGVSDLPGEEVKTGRNAGLSELCTGFSPAEDEEANCPEKLSSAEAPEGENEFRWGIPALGMDCPADSPHSSEERKSR